MMLSGSVLNGNGLDRRLACGVERVCTDVSASGMPNRRNTDMEAAEGRHDLELKYTDAVQFSKHLDEYEATVVELMKLA